MLTTKPFTLAQPIYLPPEAPPEIVVKRKRGAQPGNQNARKIRARQESPSSAAGPTYIDLERQLRRKHYASLVAGIHEFTEFSQILSDQFDSTVLTNQPKASERVLKVLITCAESINTLAHHIIALTYQDRTLAKCADHAYLARQRTNPNICVFKPSFSQHSNTLSTYAGGVECPVSFLNDRQWFILERLIADQVAEDKAAALASRDPAKQQRASRLVPWPERFLLDGILWKLATACTWAELPQPYPVRRCQALYQSLHRSGRIGHIYTLLHEDFNEFGDLSLKEMALNGDYMLWGSKILYIPHGKHTWQGLVSLLLLQCTRRRLLVEQRNRPPTLEYLLEHGLPNLPRLPRIPEFYSPIRRWLKPRKMVPPGILRIPPPFKHPSLKNILHLLICHPPVRAAKALRRDGLHTSQVRI